MSVIKSKRNIAESEHITTMRELHRYTFEKCKKFPKSQTFYYGESIRMDALYKELFSGKGDKFI